MIGRILTFLFAAIALAAPASAGAHIRVQPEEAPASTYTVLRVNVPNETAELATTRVEVRFPEGFAYALDQPLPGWSAEVKKTKAAKSALTGQRVPARVARVIWTAKDPAAGIQPKQFQDFPIAVQIPGKVGEKLTFKALQAYEGGEVVRWVGAPGSQEPAPQVLITAEKQGTAVSEEASAEGSDDGDNNGLAIAALIAAILALVAAGAALIAVSRAAQATREGDKESPAPTEPPSDPPAS